MPTRSGPLSRRRFFSLAAMALAGGTLAACSGDSSRDAERGREADTQRESVVKDLQATQTWNLIHGTPPATPAADGE